MSVLIKGMKMPNNCQSYPMLYDGRTYKWCNITGESLGKEEANKNRDTYCPLVEIPTPHGDLKDVDEINKRLNGHRIIAVDFANTIIEAEREE